MNVGDRVIIKSRPYTNLTGRIKAITVYSLWDTVYTIKVDFPNLVPLGWKAEPNFREESLIFIGTTNNTNNVLINE